MTEQEWLASTDPASMIDYLTRGNSSPGVAGGQGWRISARKLRLFACACCRQPEVWDRLVDDVVCDGVYQATRARCSKGMLYTGMDGMKWIPCNRCQGSGRINRSRRAVEVAERYADGLATDKERADAFALATEATVEATRGSIGEYARADVARVSVMRPQILPQHVGQWNDLHRYDILPNAVQATLLRDIVGNPWKPVMLPWRCVCGTPCGPPTPGYYCVMCGATKDKKFCPWLTCEDGRVLKMAQSIYNDRTFDLLPILHDALIEAGCDNQDILSHCFETTHACGCWVVDLLLSKE